MEAGRRQHRQDRRRDRRVLHGAVGGRPPPARLPRARPRAAGRVAHRRADRHGPHPRGAGPHLRDRRRRVLRRVDVPALRRVRRPRPRRARPPAAASSTSRPSATPPTSPSGSSRRRACSASRSGTPRGVAASPAGTSSARPWPPSTWAPLRHPHRRRRPHPRAPHQRGGPERVRARRAPVGADLDAQRVPRPRRREDLEVEGPRARRRLARRARVRPAGVPLLLPPGPLPPAAGLHAGRRSRRPPPRTAGWSATPSPPATPAASPIVDRVGARTCERFWSALADDLNAPQALAAVWDAVRDPELAPADRVGLPRRRRPRPRLRPGRPSTAPDADESGSDPRIDALVAEREAARAAKDFATSDRIRDELAAEGIELVDTPDGPTWRRRVGRARTRP